MVYDEGFSVEFEELSFFSFSNYLIDILEDNVKTYKSKCYSTCVGWYRNKDGSQWGCYRAFKVGRNPESVTYSTSINTQENSVSVIQKERNVISSNRVEENIIENSIREGNPKRLYEKLIDTNLRKKIDSKNSFLSLKDSASFINTTNNQHYLYANKLNRVYKSSM